MDYSRVVCVVHADLLCLRCVQEIRRDEREALLKLHRVLAQVPATDADLDLVVQSTSHLDELLMMCVVGACSHALSHPLPFTCRAYVSRRVQQWQK